MSRSPLAFVLTFVIAASIVVAGDGVRSDSVSLRRGTPSPPLPDPSGLNKIRFISLVPPAGGGDSALRVNLFSLHHVEPPYSGAITTPFTVFEGQSVWVGPPAQYPESSASGILFFASHTQCEPHYRDWSTIALLHVTGSHIVPSSDYLVEAVSDACAGVEDSIDCLSGGVNVSTQLEVSTDRWGDIEIPYNSTTASPRQPNFSDVAIIDKKFRAHPIAPIKVRVLTAMSTIFGEITPQTLNVDIGLTNFANAINAFTGQAYPGKMGKCAGNPSPPATGACSSDSECAGSNGAPPCLLYCPD